MTFITPYLPEAAYREIQLYEKQTGKPAFILAYEKAPDANACPNCQGIGVIMVRFTKAGPLHSPPGDKSTIVTWYEGGDKHRKGYYIVGDTKMYPCPKCKGVAPELSEFVPGPGVGPQMAELTKMFEGRRKR